MCSIASPHQFTKGGSTMRYLTVPFSIWTNRRPDWLTAVYPLPTLPPGQCVTWRRGIWA